MMLVNCWRKQSTGSTRIVIVYKLQSDIDIIAIYIYNETMRKVINKEGVVQERIHKYVEWGYHKYFAAHKELASILRKNSDEWLHREKVDGLKALLEDKTWRKTHNLLNIVCRLRLSDNVFIKTSHINKNITLTLHCHWNSIVLNDLLPLWASFKFANEDAFDPYNKIVYINIHEFAKQKLTSIIFLLHEIWHAHDAKSSIDMEVLSDEEYIQVESSQERTARWYVWQTLREWKKRWIIPYTINQEKRCMLATKLSLLSYKSWLPDIFDSRLFLRK